VRCDRFDGFPCPTGRPTHTSAACARRSSTPT
jgi:hypothetical protein